MSKYAVFFTLKGEAIARAMEQPSDRVLVVSKAVESAGGTLEAYYLMFGQYDGFVIVDLPDSRAAAATSLAVSSTGAFEHLETHELIEAEDLNPILEQAKGITSQLPGTLSTWVRQSVRSGRPVLACRSLERCLQSLIVVGCRSDGSGRTGTRGVRKPRRRL